jgi:hypothetical protein
MIEQSHVDQRERVAQLCGHDAIRGAWIRDAARVVVRDDDGGRVVTHGGAHHFARVNACTVDRAGEHPIDRDHAVLGIKPNRVEFLVVEVGETRAQELLRRAWAGDFSFAHEACAEDFLGAREHSGIVGREVVGDIDRVFFFAHGGAGA